MTELYNNSPTVPQNSTKEPVLQLRVISAEQPRLNNYKTRDDESLFTWSIRELSYVRRDEAGIDNTYNKHKVASIRNDSIEKYLSKAERAAEQNEISLRKAFRAVALKKLKEGIAGLQQLLPLCEDDVTRSECLLAITELQYKSKNYTQAIRYGKEAVDTIDRPRLKSQAYYYLVRSYGKSGELETAENYIEMMRRKFPGEADIFFGDGRSGLRNSSEYESLRRKQSFYYELAETFDDMLLRDKRSANTIREYRDDAIEKILALGEKPIGEHERWLKEESLNSVFGDNYE